MILPPGVVEIFLALIGAGQAIILANMRRSNKDVKMIKHEVKNDHTTNLREEQDERHREVVASQTRMETKLEILDRRDLSRGQDLQQVHGKIEDVRMELATHVATNTQQLTVVGGRLDQIERKLP